MGLPEMFYYRFVRLAKFIRLIPATTAAPPINNETCGGSCSQKVAMAMPNTGTSAM